MAKKKQLDVPITGVPSAISAKGELPTVMFRGKVLDAVGAKAVDLVFAIDTTGSMSDKIEGVLTTCAAFLDNFVALGLDYRVGIIAFGDLTVAGDRIVATPFMTNLGVMQKTLRKIPRYGGGGNAGESSLEAVHAAIGMQYRATAVKVLILITDEPALLYTHSPMTTTLLLKQREILTYVISPAIDYFKEMAKATGGSWMQITTAADFSALLSMLRQLAKDVSVVVNDVHRLSRGSVQSYLQLVKSTD